jgi:hypothetical protein
MLVTTLNPSYSRKAIRFSGGEMGFARLLSKDCSTQSGGTATVRVPWYGDGFE